MTEKLSLAGNIIANPIEHKYYYMVIIENGYDDHYSVVYRQYKSTRDFNLVFRGKLYLDEKKALRKADKLNFSHHMGLNFAKILNLLVGRAKQVICSDL